MNELTSTWKQAQRGGLYGVAVSEPGKQIVNELDSYWVLYTSRTVTYKAKQMNMSQKIFPAKWIGGKKVWSQNDFTREIT